MEYYYNYYYYCGGSILGTSTGMVQNLLTFAAKLYPGMGKLNRVFPFVAGSQNERLAGFVMHPGERY